jgi:hypothetical protein
MSFYRCVPPQLLATQNDGKSNDNNKNNIILMLAKKKKKDEGACNLHKSCLTIACTDNRLGK